jgi:hypothetical protein
VGIFDEQLWGTWVSVINGIMLDPVHDENTSKMPFVREVEADCTQGMKGH